MESEHHRLVDEDKRPGRRAALSEDIIRQMQALATNAGCLAVSMKNMAKIQAKQAELGQFIYQSCILDIQPG